LKSSGRTAEKEGVLARRWGAGLGVLAVFAGCSGGEDKVDPASRTPTRVVSNAEGVAVIGSGQALVQIYVLDAENQNPVADAQIDLVPQKGGYLARISKSAEAYQSQVLFVPRGSVHSVAMRPITPDVRVRMIDAAVEVADQDFI